MMWNIRKQKNDQSEQEEEKRIKKKQTEDSISSVWDNFQRPNIHIKGVPEKKRKNKKLEIYLKK